MKRESLLYRITNEHHYCSDDKARDASNHWSNTYKHCIDEHQFKATADSMKSTGLIYLLYSPNNHRLFDHSGTGQLLGYADHWKLSTQIHGKMHPVSQCFNAIQLHILLKLLYDEGNVPKDKEKAVTGVALYNDAKGALLLMRKEILLVKLTTVKTEIGVGEILTPVCQIPRDMLNWIYPILTLMEFGKKNNAVIIAYLQQLIIDSEIFSHQQLNIIKAIKENHSYQQSLRTLAEENGVNYETLKTQTLRIRDKVNEHFKTNYTDSLSAIRFIILSNLV